MRRLLALILLLQTLNVGVAQAAHHPLLQLVVTVPYLEMHSGPGRGFPVVYVVGRDEVLTVLFSRTDWYKVRAAQRSRRGGRAARICAAPNLPRGSRRRYLRTLNFPAIAGKSGPATGFTTAKTWSPPMPISGLPTASTSRAWCSRRSARSTTAYIASIGLRHTFIPEWKWFSPTAGLGTAYQHIKDKVPPAPLESNNQMAYASLGARGFITRRFMWRADWRHYVVFNKLNVYEDLEEWKFGLAVFF